jgi:oligopeptide/dipeptide ABC transporter ATP-binding protein
MTMSKGLAVEGLTIEVKSEQGWQSYVQDFHITLSPGRAMGIAGESGSGKSITAKAIARILPPSVRIGSGQVRLDGESVLDLKEASFNRLFRGRKIAFIPQNPMTSLNPTLTIGEQMTDGYRANFPSESRSMVREWALDLLGQVGIRDPKRVFHDYPHRLSGGMRQRVIIAAAIMCRPSLLIADEPTTALDVTVQAQILELLNGFREKFGLTLLIISHDLGLLSQICDEITVMYAGRIVEQAQANAIFSAPAHPYTDALFRATPSLHRSLSDMQGIPGTVQAQPSAHSGCVFYPRCSYRKEHCLKSEPRLIPVSAAEKDVRLTACHYPLTEPLKGEWVHEQHSALT